MINMYELLKAKRLFWDPKNPVTRRYYRDPATLRRFDIAKVVDNKDPDKMGRLKIHLLKWGENAITWAPLVRPFCGDKMGIWMIPNVGDMVIVAFLNDDPIHPVVLGGVYGIPKKMVPPVRSNPDNNIKKISSKFWDVILDDKDGDEKIIVQSKDEKMQLIMDTKTGITIKNDLGSIEIECETFELESEKDVTIKAEKTVTIEADSVEVKSSKGISVKSGKNAVVKGSKIKLKGSGVTAKGKQIACKNDQAIGLDPHIVMIPTPAGLVPSPPIPHPFMGQLNDKLSTDVQANNKDVAVKGSKAKNAGPGHIPMGGPQFQKAPSNIGEVTLGCEPSVKVNGKDVAVLGAKVKTCSDPADLENATIIAMGMAVAFPASVLGLNPAKYKADRGMVRMNVRTPYGGTGGGSTGPRSLSGPMWNAVRANVGDEVELSVNVQSYPNATVHFNIWKQGANRQTDQPVKRLTATSDGSKATAKWRYVHEGEELTEKPKFEFDADSHDCDTVTSGVVEFGERLKVTLITTSGEKGKDVSYSFKKETRSGRTNAEGVMQEDAVIPGEIVEFAFNR